MSRKKEVFTPNFASDGKKPLGLAPRIGLSRNARPCPERFKSPLLASPVNYPKYNNTPSKSLDNINIDQKEKDISSKKILRNRNKVKKNLKVDFDEDAASTKDKVEHTDGFETKITPIEVTSNEKDNAITTKLTESKTLNKLLSDSTNQLDINSLLNIPILTKGLIQNKCLEPQKIATQAKSTTRKVVKSKPNENGEEGKNVREPKGETINRSANTDAFIELPTKDVKKGIEEIAEGTCVNGTNDKLLLRRKPKQKVLAPPVKKKVTTKITMPTTPEHIVERRTKSGNKRSPGCPILTPQIPVEEKKKRQSKRTKKAVRKIILNDKDSEDDEPIIYNKIPKLQREEPYSQKKYERVNNINILKSDLKASSKSSIDSDDVPLSKIREASEAPRCDTSIKKKISLSLRKSSSSSINSITKNSVTTPLEMLQLETMRNEITTYMNDIDEKEMKIKSVAEKRNVRIAELEALTKQWEDGGKRALLVLQQELTRSGQDVDMDVLLQRFNAPESVKFD